MTLIVQILISCFFVILTETVVLRHDIDRVRNVLEFARYDVLKKDDVRSNKKAFFLRGKRQITTQYGKWPDNTLTYYFDSSVSDDKKALFHAAFAHINSTTCIKFVEDKDAKNRVRIKDADSCSSYIGMNGGEQNLEFADGCMILGTAIHELMHALGIYHTHERYDRDSYVKVDYSKAWQAMVANLEKQSNKTSYNAVPFEYGSALMYAQNILGDGSLESKSRDYKRTMGNRRVSFYDMQNVNSRYQCKCQTELECKNQGYTNPSDCSKCVCPSGYEGKLCDEKPKQSIVVEATKKWINYIVDYGYGSETLHTSFYKAYVWVTAPADTKIQVQLLTLDTFTCENACNYNGIEIKTNPDPRIVNPIICCKDNKVWNRVYSSENSPLVMVIYTRKGMNKFMFRYRYVEKTSNLE